jgi:heptosyltransferase II
MIRVPNWVGDAVMAVPALKELRRIFADARITLVARPWVAGLFEGEGLADDLIPLPDGRGFAQAASNFVRHARQLRRGRFDLAVLLQNAFGAALLARLAGVKTIAGYATDRRGAILDLAVPFEPNYKSNHQVRYYLNIAAELERAMTGETHVEIESAQPALKVTDRQREHARSMLRESGIALAVPILALSPGATNSRAKRWLVERFAATADRFAEQKGFQTIIVGAPGDLEVADEVARRMRSRAVVLAGRTSIGDLKALLACCSLVVSNDNGTAHVGGALRVPTVVVFGPTEHVSTRPLSDVATIVRHDVECSPCMLRECPIDHRCMTRIEVDDVYIAGEKVLVSAAS